jgi:rubrerythrin
MTVNPTTQAQDNGGMNVTDAKLTLLNAIQLTTQAEQKAAAAYRNAAREAVNPMVRRLFEQLTEFENLHYAKLVELEQSLRANGAFIKYEAQELSTPAPGEVKQIEGVQKMSAMKALNQAMETELEAEKRYTALVDLTSDPDGKAMFRQLALEERGHYRILRAAYYDVGNLKPLG